MPFVTVTTNLARSSLPAKFMPVFCHKLSQILDKDPAKMNWILETDKQMSKGEDPSKPFLLVNIEALAVFDTKENCRKFMPTVFQALVEESGYTQEDIIVKFVPLEGHKLGKNGATFE